MQILKNIYFLIISIIIFLQVSNLFSSEIYVRNVYLERYNIAENDSNSLAWFMNNFHFKTRPFVIESELLFEDESINDYLLIEETERNLRNLGIFTDAEIKLDDIGFEQYDAYVITKDSWTTFPMPVYNTGGGFDNYGLDLDEFNFLGTGTRLKFKGMYRKESNIGWEGAFVLFNSRLPFTDLQDSIALISNKIRTSQQAILQVPYRTLSSPLSVGAKFVNYFGKDFLFKNSTDYELIKSDFTSLDLWYSRAWFEKDRLFITAIASVNKAKRQSYEYRQAYDNSGYFAMNFSSISQDFDYIKNVNSPIGEDLIYGGYGSASVGKIFPITGEGDNLYYISAAAEKSFYTDDFYLYLMASGASGFDNYVKPKYTYQSAQANYYYKISKNLLFTGRIFEEAVWNWEGWRQLLLDSENGLRGYALNEFQGDNRLFVNTELRYFINYELLYFRPSLVGFFDIGSVWKQNQKIYNSQFFHSVGFGVRFHFVKSRNSEHLFRLDFPYNFHTKQFGIVFTTKQFFSSFKNHQFSIPDLFGRKNDID